MRHNARVAEIPKALRQGDPEHVPGARQVANADESAELASIAVQNVQRGKE